MSESDSENEYESADEDTEESVSKSEESVSKLEKSVLKLGEDLSKIEQELSLELQNDMLKLDKNIDNVDLKKEDLIGDSIDIPNVKCEAKDIEKELILEKQIDSKVSNSNCKDKKSTDHSNDYFDEILKPKEIDSTEKKLTETKKSPTETESKRVTLRLEKKLQERNQSITSNESVKCETKKEEKLSSWGLGSWSTSLLSTAASSVTTFTNQVSQGIGTVLETVESTLGAPPPEDLATLLKEKREKQSLEKTKDDEDEISKNVEISDENKGNKTQESMKPATTMLLTGVTSLTKVVGDTSSKVVMGGLDALEMIGKKTMDILTEGDPGLRSKRSAFSSEVTLSQMLREAKEKAEEENTNASFQEQDAIHYSRLFDEYQGLIHLEALEMLSNQSQSKVQRALLMMAEDSEDKHIIEQISQICEDLPSADEMSDSETEQDFEASLSEHLKALQIKINLGKIEMTRNSINDWLNTCVEEQDKGVRKDAKEIYRQAISSLAEFTARCVEQFHKIGELVMIQNITEFDTLMSATHLTGLTSILCVEIGILATKYCQCLNTAADDSEDPDSITPLITSVYLEASNSTTYVQDAFQLLIPVLQAILVESPFTA